jgi:hypothetical protein
MGMGNGCFSLIATIYITNTKAIMLDTSDPNYPNHVQSVSFQGGPCSATKLGMIIVGQLTWVEIHRSLCSSIRPVISMSDKSPWSIDSSQSIES